MFDIMEVVKAISSVVIAVCLSALVAHVIKPNQSEQKQVPIKIKISDGMIDVWDDGRTAPEIHNDTDKTLHFTKIPSGMGYTVYTSTEQEEK